jgi:hypothetical protein
LITFQHRMQSHCAISSTKRTGRGRGNDPRSAMARCRWASHPAMHALHLVYKASLFAIWTSDEALILEEI